MRLNSEHHEIIVSFAEDHPEIITNKFAGLNAKQELNKLWEILVNQLNSLGYGILSVAEYKRRLSDWKSKVKAKAVESQKSLYKTGGGEAISTCLTKIEQRLLSLMGNKSYEGDCSKEIGFFNKLNTEKQNLDMHCTQPLKKMKSEISTVISAMLPPSTFNIEVMQEPMHSAENIEHTWLEDHTYHNAQTDQNIAKKSTESNITLHKTPSSSTIRRKNLSSMTESIQKMNNETLDVLKNIDKNLEGVNNNLTSINKSLEAISSILLKVYDK